MNYGEGGKADIEKPLLPKKAYPNCPGCKFEESRGPNAGLPYKEIAIVALLTLVNALPISSLYPFLYFMVRDFHVAKSEADIGFYAGIIGSAFMIGRFLTAVQWGMAADKYGRKPVMIAGVFSVIIFHTMFGASTTFSMAVITRFLLGALNGMLGTVKAYSSEICSGRYQPLSVSVVGTMWGLGLILGPAMGGYLAQPAIKYPNVFPPGSLFDRFAYLLPSLSVTVVAIPVLFISFQLSETLHIHDIEEVKGQEDAKCQVTPRIQIPRRLPTQGSNSRSAIGVFEGLDSSALLSPFGSFQESRFGDRFQRQGSLPRYGSRRFQEDDQSLSRKDSISRSDEKKMDESDAQEDSSNKTMRQPDGSEEAQGKEFGLAPEVEKGWVPLPEIKLIDSPEKSQSLWQSKPLLAAISLYCIFALHDMAYTEIFSLWCVSPSSNGGLNLTTTDVGQVLAFSGFTMLLFQVLIFPPLANSMGPVLVTRLGAMGTVPLTAGYPFIALVHGMTQWVTLRLASMLKNIFSTLVFTGSIILVNNAVVQPQHQRGAANGLSMSAVSLFKAVGPAGGGSLFAWSQNRQDAYILPGNQLVYFVLGAIAFVSVISTFEPFLPASLVRPLQVDELLD